MPYQRKLILFIACSLDGYIATADESLDWLESVEGEGDNGYAAFYETVDTVVMGRKTCDWIKKLNLTEFPYAGKACYVFSRTRSGRTDEVTWVNEDPVPFINRLKEAPGRNIWLVGGGNLLQAMTAHDLVDEYIVTIAPVILGGGIPLFPTGTRTVNLELVSTKSFNQFTELHYKKMAETP
ncbi:dihydrofolate reductase family protein [Salisediminibacterium beveridgei]|uniref:Dihydrofolate reductase n=1 Tax=Salisediminibacterium beveridgei TaxID=632773 RepID=A0A1D7QZE0_9BACI|nr:dihydrofolate reductase family protein [Salisediminibacterium beveridgei]AOM84368.1 Dihydrofolate reductase [Salisediminibacterium beveridgei]